MRQTMAATGLEHRLALGHGREDHTSFQQYTQEAGSIATISVVLLHKVGEQNRP